MKGLQEKSLKEEGTASTEQLEEGNANTVGFLYAEQAILFFDSGSQIPCAFLLLSKYD